MSSEDEALSFEERMEQYEDEVRAKYDAKELDALGAKGQAFKNANGDWSFPIADEDDLSNAVRAVGRAGSDHDAVRKYIMKVAKKLGLTSAIPENWQSDGSMAEEKSDNAPTIKRKRERHRAVPLVPELRHFTATNLEIRTSSDGATDNFVITGQPIVYNQPYSVVDCFGEFQERMMPGVASDVLSRGADVRLLFDHSGLPLARSTAGTMTLTDGPDALSFEARLDSRQQLANDLYWAIERGDVSQMSCGFRVAKDEWSDDLESRTIHSFADLLDVSAVTYPASPTTSVEIAQRMALMMPVESAARARKMYVDSRAGAKMSSKTQSLLTEAFHHLSSALSEAGLSAPSSTMDPDGSMGIPDDADSHEFPLTNGEAAVHEDGVESTTTPAGADDDVNVEDDAFVVDTGDGSSSGSILGGAGSGWPGYADGSGTRNAPSTREERAEASMSFNDQQSAVYQALLGVFGDDDGDCDLWVCDLGADWVVFESFIGSPGMGMFRVAYSCDADGNVMFSGVPVLVAVQTEYVPVEAPSVAAALVQGRSSRALRLALEARKRRRASSSFSVEVE